MTITVPGSDYYYSLRKLPKDVSCAVSTIFELFENIIRIPTQITNDSIAHLKLQWWKKEILETEQNQGTHPLSNTLHTIMKKYCLSYHAWLQIISTVEGTLQSCQFPTEQSLRDYYTYTYGIREKMIAKVLLGGLTTDAQAIYHFAYCLGLIDQLQHLRDYAKRMYGFFSDEELAAISMQKAELFGLRTTHNIQRLIQQQIIKAELSFKTGLDLPPKATLKKLRCITIRCRLALTWAGLLNSEDYQLLEKKILLTPLRKVLISL